MRIIKTKKGLALLAVLVVAAVAAIGGYAYFSSTGSGSGTAGVGSSTPVTLSSAGVTGLYPGGTSVPVTVSIQNTGGGNEYVDTISGTVADNAGCLGSWFTVAPVTYQNTVAPGKTVSASPTTVTLNESGSNQDACQGKTMTINWTSN